MQTDNQVTQQVNIEPQADAVPPVENIEPEAVLNTEVDETNQEPVADAEPTEPAPTEDAPTVEQLQAKLKEYELKEQERNLLKQKLAITDEAPDDLQLKTIEATVANRGKSEFISLCTKFGVDFTPENIEASSEALKQRDPKAYYEFVYNAEKLQEQITAQQHQIHSTRVNHEIESFYQINQPLIEASPVINRIVESYIRENYNSMQSPTAELNNLIEGIKEIYIEALEAGKLLAKHETVTKDKTGLQTSVATDNTSAYQLQAGQTPFTREQIRNMSDADFRKYEKVIQQQAMAGLIR